MHRPLIVPLAGIAVLATATIVLVTCRPATRPLAVAPDQNNSAGIATRPGPFQAGPVAPPPSGALLGAWVKPAVFTQPARVEAVTTLESALGRPLDFVNTYRRFGQPLPPPAGRTAPGARPPVARCCAGARHL